MATDRARNNTINSLRAIAAFSVVSNHVMGAWTPVVDLGLVGVILFFLISGYVIVWSLEGLGERPVRNFLIRRAFRLYPAYWISVVFATVLGYALEPITKGQFIVNLTMFQEAFGVADIDGVYWTLFLEWIFYIIITVLLAFKVARRNRTYEIGLVLTAVGALFAAAVWRFTGHHIPFGHVLMMSVFAMGGVTSMLHRHGNRLKWMWPIAAVYLAIVFAVSQFIFGKGGVSNIYTPAHYFANHAVPVVLFLVSLNFGLFAWRWLAYLGDLSYSVYLYHSPINWNLRGVFSSKWMYFGAVSAIVLVIAVIVRRFIELPAIEVGRRLTKKHKEVSVITTAV